MKYFRFITLTYNTFITIYIFFIIMKLYVKKYSQDKDQSLRIYKLQKNKEYMQ